jgi:hypothetical protein
MVLTYQKMKKKKKGKKEKEMGVVRRRGVGQRAHRRKAKGHHNGVYQTTICSHQFSRRQDSMFPWMGCNDNPMP